MAVSPCTWRRGILCQLRIPSASLDISRARKVHRIFHAFLCPCDSVFAGQTMLHLSARLGVSSVEYRLLCQRGKRTSQQRSPRESPMIQGADLAPRLRHRRQRHLGSKAPCRPAGMIFRSELQESTVTGQLAHAASHADFPMSERNPSSHRHLGVPFGTAPSLAKLLAS